MLTAQLCLLVRYLLSTYAMAVVTYLHTCMLSTKFYERQTRVFLHGCGYTTQLVTKTGYKAHSLNWKKKTFFLTIFLHTHFLFPPVPNVAGLCVPQKGTSRSLHSWKPKLKAATLLSL